MRTLPTGPVVTWATYEEAERAAEALGSGEVDGWLYLPEERQDTGRYCVEVYDEAGRFVDWWRG